MLQSRQYMRDTFSLLAFFLLLLFSEAHHLLDDWRGKAGEALSERQWVSGGIEVVTVSSGECTQDQIATLNTAILDASYLAGAALNAAANFTELPFRYFFKGDLQTANTVAGVYRRVQYSQRGGGNLIWVACRDILNSCESGSLINPAYIAQGTTAAPVIVFCPAGLALSRNPVPCTQTPGAISLGWVMLHEMIHAASISGPDLEIYDTTGETPRDVQDALNDGKDTTLDASSYAHLGTWAWDMGLGGPPWNQRMTCLQNFPKGQFDLEGRTVINAAMSRGG